MQIAAGPSGPQGLASHAFPTGTVVSALVLNRVQLEQQLLEIMADVTGVTPLSVEQPLMEAGIDSIGSVELRNAVNERFGVDAPATLVFDNPSIAALASWLEKQLGSTPPEHTLAASAQLGVDQSASHPAALTAITGVSCCYPAEMSYCSNGVSAFWHQAISGRDVQSAVPLCKWDIGERQHVNVLACRACAISSFTNNDAMQMLCTTQTRMQLRGVPTPHMYASLPRWMAVVAAPEWPRLTLLASG